ncbi:GAF domain-containing protein [Cryptosporangium arvum]|uniref:GAF domain-containing protein n=1 Tax=Cryptosporangium arvum TaxID=80871 RepID=UPI0004BBA225|nr:GAF domain-containing protein [Cryptosporangium arvum]
MQFVESTLGDPARLAEVGRYDPRDPALTAELDDIAARTVAWTGRPISLITLLGGEFQYCVGLHGLPSAVRVGDRVVDRFSVPVRWSFCAPMIRNGHSHVVADLRAEPLLGANPFVTALGLRGYAGVPLFSAGGDVIGSHCLLSPEPFTAGIADVLALETGAADALAALGRYRS